MKKFIVLLVLALVLSGTAMASIVDMFNVNLWATGKAWGGGAWEDPATHALLTLAPEQEAGVWRTAGWENVGWGSNPFATSLAPTTINSSGGSTATLEVLNQRNSGSYNWNSLRDDSDTIDLGNATLLDGHSNSTYLVNANDPDPGSPALPFDMTISDIAFDTYDMIVYLGINAGQKFDGKGTIIVNGGTAQSFTLLTSEPTGELVEIVDETTAGNYIVFEGLTGSTLTIQTYGDGFTHLGPAGIQIAESVPEPATMALLALGGLGLFRRRRNG